MKKEPGTRPGSVEQMCYEPGLSVRLASQKSRNFQIIRRPVKRRRAGGFGHAVHRIGARQVED